MSLISYIFCITLDIIILIYGIEDFFNISDIFACDCFYYVVADNSDIELRRVGIGVKLGVVRLDFERVRLNWL